MRLRHDKRDIRPVVLPTLNEHPWYLLSTCARVHATFTIQAKLILTL